MDQRESVGSFEEAFRAALEGWQAKIWTCLPGIIQSFDPGKITATVQIAIQGQQLNLTTGVWSNVNLPLLVDCPVKFPNGGGYSLTFPIAQGDECEVSFSSRCIDAWWQSGGVQPQAEFRMHDLSDGFVEVGPRSQARVIPNISTTSAQLRSDDGAAYVEIAAGHVVNVVAPGGINLTGPVTITGTCHVTQAVTVDSTVTASGEGTFNGIEASQHVHHVTAVNANTNPPTG